MVRAIRSPYQRARFRFGDLDAFVAAHPGIHRVLTVKDIPGENRYGVIPRFADQPVFAETETRFRGEAVAAVVGETEAVEALNLANFPVVWEELPALTTMAAALAPDAERIHPNRENNVLVRGRVVRGDVETALAESDVVVEDEYETGFIEHAYIEPEAGFARRVNDQIEIQACTQAPYMDRADIAKILGIAPEAVRIIPTAVGGGFGAKLDLSVQPFVALAAWHLRRPVRMVYSRTESIISTTKRHPSHIRLRVGATRDGKLTAMDCTADFNTGAYSSWGPTVAARVPVHASGPYYVPHYRALTRAVHTNLVPAGAFRGFGVPQTAIAQEQLYDDLANKLAIDRLEFRILNALDDNTPTVTGQVLGEGVGIRACFEALQAPVDSSTRRSEGVQCEMRRPSSSRRRRRRHVVRMRQHFPAESLHDSRGIESERPHRASSGSGGYRTRLQHHRHANLRGRAGRSHRSLRPGIRRYVDHARLRQDLRVSPDLCYRQSRIHGGHGTAPRHSAPGRRVRMRRD